MAANFPITCPTCDKKFNLRFDPGPENEAPQLAMAQLRRECPSHEGGWTFWDTINSEEWVPFPGGARD